MLGVEEALLGMGEQLGVWRTNAGCVEKHCWVCGVEENQCWVCGEVCKEAMLGVGEAVSSVGKTLQRADKRVCGGEALPCLGKQPGV